MLEIYSNIVVFLAMNSLVAFCAYQFVKLFNFDSLRDNLLAYALLFCSQIILTELILGIFGRLTLSNLITLNLAVFLFASALLRKDSPFKGLKLSLFSDFAKDKLIALVFSSILGFGIIICFINLINPPFGWDSLNYHFTFPVEWIKHGNLINPITINDDPSPSYYPMNGSLIFNWLMFPFKSVFFADLGQLPFFILSFIAVFALARRLGINKKYAVCAASVFVLIPNFFKELEFGYVDIILCAFILITLNFFLLLNEKFSLKSLLISAVGFGLAIGTKTIAVTFGAILSILLILILAKQRGIKKIILSLIIFNMTVILLGGYSYINNFFLTKNFLFPVDVELFGKTIFKGVLDMSYYKAHYLPRDYSLEKLLFHEGLGLQTTILILPAILLSIPLTLTKNKTKASISFTYFLITPLLIYFTCRYLIPLSASRYLYPALGVGLAVAFFNLQLLKISSKFVYGLVLTCIISSCLEITKRNQLICSLLLSGLIFGLTFINFKKIRLKGITWPVIFTFLVFLFVLSLGFLQKDYLENEFSRYANPALTEATKEPFWSDAARAWAWLNEHTERSRIAYVGKPIPFPLYGSRFKNQVYYVSVNRGQPYLHAYPNGRYQRQKDYLTLHRNLQEPGNYREDPDYSVWLSNLLRKETDYLFVYSLHQTKEIVFPLEDKWAIENPVKFAPVFTNETIHIYKILK